MSHIGELIKSAREARKTEKGAGTWTQQEVAKAVGATKQYLSRVERGADAPSLRLLLNLHEILVATDDHDSDILIVWLLKLLESHVRMENVRGVTKEKVQSAIDKAVTKFQLQSKPGLQLSLEHFPYAFQPLTVICGDRREVTPKTRGDIFADSISITDLTFLPMLGLPKETTVRSDKFFVLLDEAYLQREFGNTNLLVIGSPAVNFAARVINNHSLFRFNLPPWLRRTEEIIRTLREPEDSTNLPISLKELNDRQTLGQFWQIAQHPERELLATNGDNSLDRETVPDELVMRLMGKTKMKREEIERVRQLATLAQYLLGGDTTKSLMNNFRSAGLMDFADATLHGTSPRDDNDFGLISIARNPFATSGDYVCVMVAGIHGPGTAHALRALADGDFREHSLGGIIEVELDLYSNNWPTKFQKANWKWQTKAYDANKILRNLRNALGEVRKDGGVFEHLTDAEIEECMSFVEQITHPPETPDQMSMASQGGL